MWEKETKEENEEFFSNGTSVKWINGEDRGNYTEFESLPSFV